MTRAIVEGRLDNYHYRVRIPLLNKLSTSVGATPTSELAIATVVVVPGLSPRFRTGDVVFIDYEENDTSRPVIVGRLYNESGSQIVSDAALDSLQVSVNTELPATTSIGNVTPTNILYLQGVSNNIQYQFDENSEQHENFVQKISELTTQVNGFSTTTDELNTQINNIKQNVNSVNNSIEQIQETLEGPLILNRVSYGTSAPSTISNPVEGQLYLYIQ